MTEQPTATLSRRVRIEGLNELRKKCDWDFLAQPEMEDARDTIVARMLRGGKGQGVKRNTLTPTVYPISSASTSPLAATVESTLNWPRTKGTSWGRYQEKVIKGIVARNAVRKAIQRIEQRWAS